MWGFFINNWFTITTVSAVVGIAVGSYVASPAVMIALAKRYWRELLVGGVVLALVLYITQLNHTIAEQAAQLEIDRINIQTLTSNNEKLEQAIDNTNTAIDKFGTFTVDAKKQFGGLANIVDARNQQLGVHIQTIVGEKRPQTCDDAIMYLIEARKEYAR